MTTYLVASPNSNSSTVMLAGVSATSLPAGAAPTVKNTGTANAANLVFGIPAGATGAQGAAGPAPTLTLTSEVLSPGATPTASLTGSSGAYTLNLGLAPGAAGAAGLATAPLDHVASIALLQSYYGTANAIAVDGYYGTGTPGGGIFVWNSSSTAATDSGTIFLSSTRGSTGRWIRVYGNFVTPAMFGAYGNNSANDTAALQACFAAGNTYQVAVDLCGLTYLTGPVFASFVNGVPAGPAATVEATSAPEIRGGNGRLNAAAPFTGALFNYQNIANNRISGLTVNAANSSATAALGPISIDTSWNVVSNPVPSQLNVYDHVRADGAAIQAWLATCNNDSQFMSCVCTTSLSTAAFPVALNIEAAGGGLRFIACEWYGVVSGCWQTCDVLGGVDQGWNFSGGSYNILNFFGGYHYNDSTLNAIVSIGYGQPGTGITSSGILFSGGGCFLNNNNASIINGPGHIVNNPGGAVIQNSVLQPGPGITGTSVVGSSLVSSWGPANGNYNSLVKLNNCSNNGVASNSPSGGSANGSICVYERLSLVTIAGLPASPSIGVEQFISNGVANPMLGSAVSATGSTAQRVWYNGTGWVYG